MALVAPRLLVVLLVALNAPDARAQQGEEFPEIAEASNYGYSGLVNMPDARLSADGVATGGFGFSRPYLPFFASMPVLPRLELNFRYTRIMDIAGFGGTTGFGDYKDKAIDFKFVLLKEDGWLPQIALGAHDIHGTRLLPAEYLVASKRFGALDLSVGYGQDRLDGLFGGLRYRPAWLRGFGLVLEYDAFDYANDFRANLTEAGQRDGGLTPALEYRYDIYSLRISSEDGQLGARFAASVPWGLTALVPKTAEPLPLLQAPAGTQTVPRAAWQDDAPALRALHGELRRQQFTGIRLALLPDGMLEARLEHERYTHTGRAVGRAARTLLLMGPPDITGLRITYGSDAIPIATYQFSDLAKLRGYFDGTVSPVEFQPTVTVTYASPASTRRLDEYALDLTPDRQAIAPLVVQKPDFAAGVPLSISGQLGDGWGYYVQPFALKTFFNDPTGALKYDVYSSLRWGKRFGASTFLQGSARLSLVENLSETLTILPPTTVPTVRGDYGHYLDAGRLKLDTLMLVKYWHLDERLYARASAGLYDFMFGGVGGEILWLPKRGNWAASFSLEGVKKRDYSLLSFQDYATLQAYTTLHYRIPTYGITLSATAGRFLARDEGVRFEFVRELRSGFRFGMYYTVTNANLETYPGAPGDPYYDKGVFVSIPFQALLDRDTRNTIDYGLSPWLTDVGQSAKGPSLYRHVERTLMLNHRYYNPLTAFGN